MDETSLWVPWLFVLALGLPVVALRAALPGTARALTVTLLVPALVMAVVSVWLTVDRQRVGQSELDDAAVAAASALNGSFGPVNTYDVTTLVGDELDHEVVAERSDPEVPDDQNASYTIEVRLDEEGRGPAACLDVALETLAAGAPDLRFANVEARSGSC